MAAERVPMRKLREVIRLKLQLGLSGRAIARSCHLSPSTASDYLARVAVAKLIWPLPQALDDDGALSRLLFPDEHAPVPDRPEPDWAWVHSELRRKHVTKLLLWQEYREAEPGGYQYSAFCERYLRWARPLSATMRQEHRVGEKCFVDFSGDGIDVIDPLTGECALAKLFVAVLGGSSLTYAEPALSEDLPTWVGCHVRAFDYFGGVSEIWTPDNLRSGVKKACKYDPEINRTYADLARHYDAVVIPARPYKPRDKAKVEAGVLLAERWILAVLRNRTFYSLGDLREAVKGLVERLNNRPMRRLKKSRRELFETLERGALKPLPSHPYELAEWARPMVQIDYHVAFDEHFYSVPYQLLGEQLDLRATEKTIEIFKGGNRITSHVRSRVKYGYTTKLEHMPRNHREYADWSPTRLVQWAKKVGPSTAQLVEQILRRNRHPVHGFKGCLGIMHLQDKYPIERIERACTRALKHHAYGYRHVAAILKNRLDTVAPEDESGQATLPLHGNLRGRSYYH